MSEGDIGRLFDRLEENRRESEKQHLEVMVSLAKVEGRLDNHEEDMAKHQDLIATLHQCVSVIKTERATEKGKLSGIILAATLAGNIIMVILSRTGVIDTIFGR